MSIDRLRAAEITALLTHISGMFDSLPLAAYADAIQAEANSNADQHGDGSTETMAGSFRRARRIELMSAADHATEFVAAMEAAMAHYRAARRADQLEYAAEPEHLRADPAPVANLADYRVPPRGGVLDNVRTLEETRVFPHDLMPVGHDDAPA